MLRFSNLNHGSEKTRQSLDYPNTLTILTQTPKGKECSSHVPMGVTPQEHADTVLAEQTGRGPLKVGSARGGGADQKREREGGSREGVENFI